MASVAVAALCEQAITAFCRGEAATATALLQQAYRREPDCDGILVNLGLGLSQQGLQQRASRCYELALGSDDAAVRRAAHKNLGLLRLWQGHWAEGWQLYRQRHRGLAHGAHEWRGDPLQGQPLLVWNDLGMGDAFHFVRYTLPLVQRGERVRLAVHASQVELISRHLAWPLLEVVDRDQVDLNRGPHIPLIHLVPLLDPELHWGRNWGGPTFTAPAGRPDGPVGLCWASNPGDATMAPYKSVPAERLLALAGEGPLCSLQTDEPEAHRRLGLVPARRDWCATLASIGQCREVISVDTAVAHLAAGCGVPVQLLLADMHDWRWRHWQRGPWYPSLRPVAAAGAAAAAPAGAPCWPSS